MSVLYFQCLSGISGDMTVGALLDLGIDQQAFLDELRKIGIDGYEIEIHRRQKNGITGTKFDVILAGESHGPGEGDAQTDPHRGHGHHHHHGHHHEHGHGERAHAHPHRNLHDIEALIDNSDLSEAVKSLSKKIFGYVAHAEAHVHDKPLEEVHFHEVGAIDSIVDIVGTAIAVDMLDIDGIYSSPLHVGTGYVQCQHGRIPVPAPATVEILKGVPVYSQGIRSELVTPTGAAIIRALAEDFVPLPEMAIEQAGYGIGTKDLPIANVLRVFLGKKKPLNPFFS